MTTQSRRKTRKIASQTAELAFAVPQVVAHRVARMALAGHSPSARDRSEFTRMVAEKQSAFARSFSAMAMQAAAANQALAASMLRSMWSPWLGGAVTPAAMASRWQGAALGVVASGMAPVHRTAVANARRLARVRRSAKR